MIAVVMHVCTQVTLMQNGEKKNGQCQLMRWPAALRDWQRA